MPLPFCSTRVVDPPDVDPPGVEPEVEPPVEPVDPLVEPDVEPPEDEPPEDEPPEDEPPEEEPPEDEPPELLPPVFGLAALKSIRYTSEYSVGNDIWAWSPKLLPKTAFVPSRLTEIFGI